MFNYCWSTFTFMHLADAFIQSDLPCIQAIHFYFIFYQYVCSLGIEPTTFCAANAMFYHWATGTRMLWDLQDFFMFLEIFLDSPTM